MGGALKGYVDWRAERRGLAKEEDELGKGSLFATGLIAGGALTGVLIAILAVVTPSIIGVVNVEEGMLAMLGHDGYMIFGTMAFGIMMAILYRVSTRTNE